MPTYEFRCPKCSHHFEAVLPFGSKRHPLCPKCRHAKTEKLIAPPTIHFKGSGFFKTDSRPMKKSDEPKTPSGVEGSKAEKPPKSDQPSKTANKSTETKTQTEKGKEGPPRHGG